MEWGTPQLHPVRRVLLWWHELSPPGLFVFSFAALIGLGTCALRWLPGLYVGPGLGWIDALFTATSAVCVTGLTVVDTATYFTRLGQLVILALIQLGGLGLFTLTTLIIGALGRRLSLRSEVVTGLPPGLGGPHRVSSLGVVVARFTLFIEAAGALVLFVAFRQELSSGDAAWHALFHSVSAFCNAGFSTFSDSMIGFADRPTVLVPLSSLIVLGSTGFLSLEETSRWLRSGRVTRLSTHTWAALAVTAALLAGGTVLFAFFEWEGVLRSMGFVDRLVNAWFMAVTPRTAGFNSVSYAEVTNASASLTILLMTVGGSPGSMAGGIKTTSFAVLIALALARVRGRRSVNLHDRTVPEGTVQRTVSLTIVAFILLATSVFVFGYSESHLASIPQARQAFLPHLFEVVSALGTVGLSMDLTPQLSPAARLVEVALMFLGRVGPLSFFAAVSLRASARVHQLRLAREDVIVG